MTMKLPVSLLLCLACVTSALAQKVEFAAQLNTGFAKFSGESAERDAYIGSFASDRAHSFSYDSHGSRNAVSYGASLQVQRVTYSNFILGAQAGAEALRSRTNIKGVVVTSDITSSYAEVKQASGKAILQNKFINLHPFLGYRILARAVDLDLNVGPDVGIGLSGKEKGEASDEDKTSYKIDRERNDPVTDVRARIGITAYYHHFGLSTSYAYGLTNYLRMYDGGQPELYARVFRLGLLYRL